MGSVIRYVGDWVNFKAQKKTANARGGGPRNGFHLFFAVRRSVFASSLAAQPLSGACARP